MTACGSTSISTNCNEKRCPCVDAQEDVLALSSDAINVMPSQSLRGALFCATEMLRNHMDKHETAVLRDEKELQRLQQEVAALAASLKVLLHHAVCPV
jgi:hypothetical protein